MDRGFEATTVIVDEEPVAARSGALAQSLQVVPAPTPPADPSSRIINGTQGRLFVGGLRSEIEGQFAAAVAHRWARHTLPDEGDAVLGALEGDDPCLTVPALGLRARMTSFSQVVSSGRFVEQTITGVTDAGDEVTIERDGRGITVEIVPAGAHSLWRCAIGDIDTCAAHRWNEGWRSTAFARIVRSYARSLTSAPDQRGGRREARRERKRRLKA